MKNIFIIFILLSVTLSAEVVMKKAEKEKPEISHPIEKPIRPIHPIYPVRPIINTGVVYQDNYYNDNYVSSCNQYIEIIAQKDEEILALRTELRKLKNKEQAKMSQSLKESYAAELKKFDERKSSIKTKNSVTITKEPVH